MLLYLLSEVAPAVHKSGALSPLITIGGIGVGLLTLVGFFIAARAYMKAKSIDSLGAINTILRAEVDALQQSRLRMEQDLKEAQATIVTMGDEIARLSARTDLTSHQKHLDKQHADVIAVLTRIADESAKRNGDLAALVTTVLTEAREERS